MEEKIFYNSTDNIKLCGLLSKVNNNKEIVILCHGLISNKESKGFNTLVKELQLNNINSFRFDFRSRGESTGNFIEMTNRNNDSFKLGKELYKEVYNLVPYKNIIDLEIPILFVHGLNDEIVPYELSIKVSKMCKMAKLELIENGNHSFKSDISTLNKAVDVTLDFIQKIFK